MRAPAKQGKAGKARARLAAAAAGGVLVWQRCRDLEGFERALCSALGLPGKVELMPAVV